MAGRNPGAVGHRARARRSDRGAGHVIVGRSFSGDTTTSDARW